VHPVHNSGREHNVKDDEISVISSQGAEKLYKERFTKKQTGRREWHSDITFEPVPSDYTVLRLTELPKTGGG
jgi:alpha-ketoglutarate-dependent taurine dioxygenase